MKKRRRHEPEGQDRWLLTYADLITLLLGLFVILYAMSNIDTKKYGQWIAAFGGIFGSNQIDLPRGIGGQGMAGDLEEQFKVKDMLKDALGTDDRAGAFSIEMDDRGVTVHLQEELLFPSGSADLKPGSLVTLDSLARVLSRLPNDVRVEGHSDDRPIRSERFPTNWHLSVGRATAAAFTMIERHGILPDRVAVVGYGDRRPLAGNDTERGRALNRRVDIVILMSAVTRKLNEQRQQAIQGG